MATLVVQEPTLAGITPSYAAADVAGDVFALAGGTYLVHLKNSNASPRVVTFDTPAKVDGIDIANPTVTVPATTGDKLVKLTAPQLFANASGQCAMSYDAVTGLTVAVFKA